MKILVANFGSTSFKYRLYQMGGAGEVMLAKGGHERVTDYAQAVDDSLKALVDGGHLRSAADLGAVGFKTVLGKDLSGCVCDDQRVLDALDGFARLAPAHNPPYAEGIRAFARLVPEVPRVALFETAFYQWVDPAASVYAVPKAWREAGLRRYGFHGASHKFIAERSAELLGRPDVAARTRDLYIKGPGPFTGKPLRVVSCHLGGSSSVTGILNGVAIGTSMGFSPQSGLPQNNRVGDLDSAAVPFIMERFGLTSAEVQKALTKEGGLLGLSGVGNDVREIRDAAQAGNPDAKMALDHFVREIRRYIGGYMLEMGGLDALVFTAGIGENNDWLRADVCRGLEEFGLLLDPAANAATRAKEADLSAPTSRAKVLVIPTNEELVVAREAHRLLLARKPN